MGTGRIRGITVEIGGDTTKLSAALKDVDKSISSTQQNLKDVNRLLKLDPTNTELIAQKQKYLAQAIEDTTKRLVSLKEASAQATQALQNGEISKTQYEALQREIISTEERLKSLQGTLRETDSVWSASFKAAGDKMVEVGDKVSSVGMKLTTGVSTPIAAVGAVALKSSIDFESAFTGVQKTVDATREEFEALSDGIKDMSTKTASSKTEIAGVMEVAGQLGVEVGKSGETLLKFTQTMVELGDTTNISAQEAATALAKFANITGTSQKDVDRLGSAIVDLGNNFATDEASIVNMSTRLASAGTIAGLTETDILALSAAMSSVGIEAEAGGTAMSQTLAAMTSAVAEFESGSTKNLNAIADVAGVSAQSFAQYWNTNPIQAIQLFVSGLGSLDERGKNATIVLDELGMSGIRQANMLQSLGLASSVLTSAVETSSTAFKENTALSAEAEKRYGTTASQISQLKESFTNIAIEIGERLLPVLKQVSESLGAAIKWWDGLSETQKTFLINAALVVAALGPIITGIGTLISAVGAITSAIGSFLGILGGVGAAATASGAASAAAGTAAGGAAIGFGTLAAAALPIIAIVAGIIAIGVLLYKNWDTIKETAGVLKEKIGASFGKLKENTIETWENIKEKTAQAWNNMKESVAGAVEKISEGMKAAWSSLKENTVNLWNGMKENVSSIGESIAENIGGIWGGIKTVTQTVHTAMKDTVTESLSSIRGAYEKHGGGLGGIMAATWESLKSVHTVGWHFIDNLTGNKLSSMLQNVTSSFSGITQAIASKMGDARAAVEGGFNNLLHSAGSGISQFISGVTGALSGINKVFSNLVSSAFEWGKDLISNMIAGVSATLHKLVDKVKDVAGSIKDFLHFSEPDKGPLSDFHTYMPDMMELLASGIEGNLYKLVGPMNQLGNALIPVPGSSTLQGETSGVTKNVSSAKIDALTEVVVKYLPKLANQDIRLDSGVLVGELSDGLNRKLGKAYV